MNRFENLPPVKWAMTHPRIAAWIVLSVGMVTLLVIEARDVGLTAGNWIALIVATVLVAGACIWIISWEDEAEPVTTEGTAAENDPESPAMNSDDNSQSTTTTTTG
jgi:K+ transporter